MALRFRRHGRECAHMGGAGDGVLRLLRGFSIGGVRTLEERNHILNISNHQSHLDPVVLIRTCVGSRLSICEGGVVYMLCSTGVPVPYWPDDGVGRLLAVTLL